MPISYQEIADGISNIHYADENKVGWTYNGNEFFIRDPQDVMIVGWDGAALWLAKNYGFLMTIPKGNN